METILIQGTDNGEGLESAIKEMEYVLKNPRSKAVEVVTPQPEVKLADILTDTQIAAMGSYGRYLQKKHPTWSREKIAKKSAALYNIKLV